MYLYSNYPSTLNPVSIKCTFPRYLCR